MEMSRSSGTLDTWLGKRPADNAVKDKKRPKFDFMKVTHNWKHVELDEEYVPEFRSIKGVLEPKPPSAGDAGYTLAVRAGCARGKSTVFRKYMRDILTENPRGRVLLLSANITYGKNLTHELKEANFDVGFYEEITGDKGAELLRRQVVVCSIESLHHIDGQKFDLVLIDEVRTILGLIGGATMNFSFSNLFLLRDLWATIPRRVICDADLLYKVSDTESVSAVQSFMDIIDQGPILCASLTRPGPAHLKRSARLFYTYKKASAGRREWMNEIRAAASEWGINKEHRFAICVGSKSQMTLVCCLLKSLNVKYKPYSGDTRKDSKNDLKNPDDEWVPYGCIVATTTLSVGVDPKHIRFARVFMWTCRTGCSVLSQLQQAQRFGRSADAPLVNTQVDILLDCSPPAVKEAATRKKALRDEERGTPLQYVAPTYETVLDRMEKRRGARLRVEMRGKEAIGGDVEGVIRHAPVCDKVLRLLAHERLERDLQAHDVRGAVVRACEHHGWEVVDKYAPTPVEESDLLPEAHIDPDDEFVTLKTITEKQAWALQHVEDEGRDAFFIDCYGLDRSGKDAVVANLGRE